MKKNISILFSLMLLSAILPMKAASSQDKIEQKIVAELQKSGFEGQVLEYKVILISNTPEVSNVRILKDPIFPQNVQAINGIVRNSRPEVIEKKGKTYYCWTISHIFVIPTSAGKISIKGGEYVAYIKNGEGINQDFWGLRKYVDIEEFKLRGNDVSSIIRALPVKDSEDFSGCIGNFKIEGWFPPGKIYAGNDAYAVFTISGYGDLEKLKVANIYKLFSKGCQLKEVERSDERQQIEGRLYSQITLTCKFAAIEEDFEIEPLCMKFFDPDIKKYYKACSDPLHWTPANQETNNSKMRRKDAIEI